MTIYCQAEFYFCHLVSLTHPTATLILKHTIIVHELKRFSLYRVDQNLKLQYRKSNKMNQHLLIVSLVGLIVGGAASWVSAESPAEKVWHALEKFAKEPEMGSTGLSYEDYEAAYFDVKENFSQQDLRERRIKSTSFKLFEDFVVIPMDRWRLSEGEDLFKPHYVKRMENAYKRFWTAYVDGNMITDQIYRTKKLVDFVLAAGGFLEKPDYLTLSVWREAEKEYYALVVKSTEILKLEDIYERLLDYETILNIFNYPVVKIMMEQFATRMNKCQTDADMAPILKEFRALWGK